MHVYIIMKKTFRALINYKHSSKFEKVQTNADTAIIWFSKNRHFNNMITTSANYEKVFKNKMTEKTSSQECYSAVSVQRTRDRRIYSTPATQYLVVAHHRYTQCRMHASNKAKQMSVADKVNNGTVIWQDWNLIGRKNSSVGNPHR